MVEEKFKLAMQGRDIWIDLKRKYSITDEWYIVIFPTNDKTINIIAREYIDTFSKNKFIKHFLMLSFDADEQTKYEGIEVKEEILTESEIEEIILYYRLQQFHRNIVIVSLNEPFGSKGFVGKKGITIEDVVRDGVFT